MNNADKVSREEIFERFTDAFPLVQVLNDSDYVIPKYKFDIMMEWIQHLETLANSREEEAIKDFAAYLDKIDALSADRYDLIDAYYISKKERS